MNTLLIVGRIEGPINTKTVGQQNLTLAEYKIDGIPCASWGDAAAKIPPVGSQVAAAGTVRAREREAKSGAKFIDISVSISRFDVIEEAPAAVRTAAQIDPLFAD